MADRTGESAPGGAPVLKEYEGEGITVTFEPRRCLHAAESVRGLPEVFDVSRRPWVLPERRRGRSGRGDPRMSGAHGDRRATRVVLCGCGASGNQPYCDHSGPCAGPDDDVPEQR
ncbi:(4Fe-4S)-binding protein [Streptomyces sp. NPDC014891]|uniref:(4Fe-4S)-binding protein n=1 Tax=Streptomyces sp. NPDC014891 TaxID=3364929 RepID=UPI003700B0F4